MVQRFRELWFEADSADQLDASAPQNVARTAKIATAVFAAIAVIQLSFASPLIGWTSAVCALAIAMSASLLRGRPGEFDSPPMC